MFVFLSQPLGNPTTSRGDRVRGRELGWVPQETFETGLRKTVEWYLANESWWQRVQDGSYRGERLGTGS